MSISRKTLGIKTTQGTKTTKSNDKRIAKADAIPMLGKTDLIAEIICVILAKNATDPTTMGNKWRFVFTRRYPAFEVAIALESFEHLKDHPEAPEVVIGAGVTLSDCSPHRKNV